LRSYVKLGERMGHWSSLDQTYIDIHGKTGRRIYADWNIPTEEYKMETIIKGATSLVPVTKELVEVEQALPLPEPESGISWTTGIGLVALVVILGAAFAKYKCKK